MALERERLLRDVLKRPGQPATQPAAGGHRRPQAGPVAEGGRAAGEAAPGRGGLSRRAAASPRSRFTYNTADVWKALAQYLQQRWKETLGINVRLDNMEWKVFLKWKLRAGLDASAATCSAAAGSRTTRTRTTGTTCSGTRPRTRRSSTAAGSNAEYDALVPPRARRAGPGRAHGALRAGRGDPGPRLHPHPRLLRALRGAGEALRPELRSDPRDWGTRRSPRWRWRRSKMGRYLLRRVLLLIPIWLAVYTLTFGLMQLTPGGPWDREKPVPARYARRWTASTDSTSRSGSSTSTTSSAWSRASTSARRTAPARAP